MIVLIRKVSPRVRLENDNKTFGKNLKFKCL